jgi:molybdate transport system ATP-binding protein
MTDRGLDVRLQQAGPIPLDVAFTCEPGQVLAIFGPSGSGKTTILRSIAGLYAPADGYVRAGGITWFDTSARTRVPVHRRAVGVVFQEYALFPHLTAIGNVMTALGHLPRGARRERAAALLELVHLSSHLDRRPDALSGGERQRVAVARALARDPAVLLLDEPFSAVDRGIRRHLQDEIDRIRQSLDIPLVLVTHDFDDVVRLATHLVILDHGRMVASGPLAALAERADLTWLRQAVGLGSILDTTVTRVDDVRGLAELSFPGGVIVAPGRALQAGRRVRLRIPAREVILAQEAPRGLSLHNVLAGRVTSLHAEPGDDHVMVQVAVGGARLLAEVTRDAVAHLALEAGAPVHVLIKSVSLELWAEATPH